MSDEYVRMPQMIQCSICKEIKNHFKMAVKKKNKEEYICEEYWEAIQDDKENGTRKENGLTY